MVTIKTKAFPMTPEEYRANARFMEELAAASENREEQELRQAWAMAFYRVAVWAEQRLSAVRHSEEEPPSEYTR